MYTHFLQTGYHLISNQHHQDISLKSIIPYVGTERNIKREIEGRVRNFFMPFLFSRRWNKLFCPDADCSSARCDTKENEYSGRVAKCMFLSWTFPCALLSQKPRVSVTYGDPVSNME